MPKIYILSEHLIMDVLKLRYHDEHISDKNRYVLLKYKFPKIIDIQLENWYIPTFCSLIINTFTTKMRKPVCLSLNPSLALLSKWAVRKTRDKITKYVWDCVELASMVTVTKRNLYF